MSGLKLFLSRWQNILGLVIVVPFLLLAIIAPIIAPDVDGKGTSAFRQVEDLKGQFPFPPGENSLLGTVPSGIRGIQLDVFYNLVWGTRSAVKFGLLAALATGLIGVLIGATSAYIGGWGSQLIMRITDAFLAFPVIVGVVVFQQFYVIANQYTTMQMLYALDNPVEPVPKLSLLQLIVDKVDPILLAIILFSWMPYARMTYSMVLTVRSLEFVEAAHALGAHPFQIIFRHLIPNSISPAIVLGARDIGGVVLLQATLTFIGIGGGSEWGELLSIGRRWIIGVGGSIMTYWWVFVPITLALILFGVGWNLLGDGVNDWLNPHRG